MCNHIHSHTFLLSNDPAHSPKVKVVRRAKEEYEVQAAKKKKIIKIKHILGNASMGLNES